MTRNPAPINPTQTSAPSNYTKYTQSWCWRWKWGDIACHFHLKSVNYSAISLFIYAAAAAVAAFIALRQLHLFKMPFDKHQSR